MPRGRPRKVDPEEALDASMLTFWKKGYEGTSLQDLCEATGMAKPGLYACFGNKDALFEKSLSHYFDNLAMPTLEELAASGR